MPVSLSKPPDPSLFCRKVCVVKRRGSAEKLWRMRLPYDTHLAEQLMRFARMGAQAGAPNRSCFVPDLVPQHPMTHPGHRQPLPNPTHPPYPPKPCTLPLQPVLFRSSGAASSRNEIDVHPIRARRLVPISRITRVRCRDSPLQTLPKK